MMHILSKVIQWKNSKYTKNGGYGEDAYAVENKCISMSCCTLRITRNEKLQKHNTVGCESIILKGFCYVLPRPQFTPHLV